MHLDFEATPILGAYVITLPGNSDERGSFTRIFCMEEFKARNLDFVVRQTSLSRSPKEATLRGMHYQKAPFEEKKLVTCVEGALYDVILDLRSDSPTFRQWYSVELSEANRKAMFVPKGVAHGFQTLKPNTVALYHISQDYEPQAACGVRWNDPAFAITWPDSSERIISKRDRDYPLVSEQAPPCK